MYKWIKPTVVLLAIVAAGAAIFYFLPSDKTVDYKTRDARIKSITRMIELCSSDIHEEIAIKDSVNGKWIVARQTIEGRIRFDLDSLTIEERGDTTFIYLPRERVDILESASPGAYDVLDSWDGQRSVFPRTLTAAEENIIKSRWQQKVRKRIYDRGYVRQARTNAVATLSPLLRQMQDPSGKQGPVILVDPL